MRIAVWMMGVALSVGMALAAPQDTGGIRVSGSVTQRVAPDKIMWNIRTIEADMSLEAAKKASDTKMKALLAKARELGIEEKQIQTGRLSIEQRFPSDRGSSSLLMLSDPRQYIVRRSLMIDSDQLERFDEIYSAFVATADIEIDAEFISSQLHELRWETRAQAVQIARKKAEAMAEAGGAKLGALIAMSENTQPSWQPPVLANTVMQAPRLGPHDADTSETSVPGMIEITERVDATFALIP